MGRCGGGSCCELGRASGGQGMRSGSVYCVRGDPIIAPILPLAGAEQREEHGEEGSAKQIALSTGSREPPHRYMHARERSSSGPVDEREQDAVQAAGIARVRRAELAPSYP